MNPIPPRAPSRDELVAALRLHLATVYQPGLAVELVRAAGGFQAAVDGVLGGRSGTPPGVRERLGGGAEAARRELATAGERGVSVLCWGTPEYPAALAGLPGMPLTLQARGAPGLLQASERTVAVVGSRRPSTYGAAQAERFGGELARRGLVVASGLALGVDGLAHGAALAVGGETVAVLGSGLLRLYPRENSGLAGEMVASGRGVLISELPLHASPRKHHFPLRNRLLSALASAVLVVEAGERSGSLITVTHALEQGRPVYALPGRVDRPECLGSLRLLLDGAAPVIGPEDVLPGAGAFPVRTTSAAATAANSDPAPSDPLPGAFGEALAKYFAAVEVLAPDRASDALSVEPGRLLRELSRLELDGYIVRAPGGGYVRARSGPGLPARDNGLARHRAPL